MKRYLRGMVLLGVSALLWACNSESTATEGGTPERLVLDPESMFINFGETKTVLVRLVDQQGGALTEPITISNVGAGLSVAPDSGFRPIYNANGELVFNKFNNELRLTVTATGLASTSFDVSAGSFTETVDVKVLPSDPAPVTFSSASVQLGETFTVTPGAPFVLLPDFQLAGDDSDFQTISVAEDGSSATILATRSFDGEVSLENVGLSYLPGLVLNSDADPAAFFVSPVPPSPLAGTDALATAPTLTLPAPGESITIYDDGTVYGYPSDNGDGGRVYKLVVTETTEYTFELSANTNRDLGLYMLTSTGDPDALGDVADGNGDGAGAFPEEGSIELEPGTYYLEVVLFDYGSESNPDYIRLTISRE